MARFVQGRAKLLPGKTRLVPSRHAQLSASRALPSNLGRAERPCTCHSACNSPGSSPIDSLPVARESEGEPPRRDQSRQRGNDEEAATGRCAVSVPSGYVSRVRSSSVSFLRHFVMWGLFTQLEQPMQALFTGAAKPCGSTPNVRQSDGSCNFFLTRGPVPLACSTLRRLPWPARCRALRQMSGELCDVGIAAGYCFSAASSGQRWALVLIPRW